MAIVYAAAVAVAAYLVTVRALRWRRYHAIHKKYEAKFKAGAITPQDAQEIMHVSALYDMPTLITYSLSFALFKTYAIPSISKLLSSTKELKSTETVAKRYADTELLISTWLVCPLSGNGVTNGKEREHVSDPRGMIALARVNWLHSKYNISNGDLLYTLCLFIFEPTAWTEKYGWRPLSPLEQHAFFVLWIEIGNRMGIQDIPSTVDALRAWCTEYEIQHMVPAPTNHDVATYTTEELLYRFPEAFGIKNFLRRITICLLEDRVRIAMIQLPQPWYLHALTQGLLLVVKYLQRYLCLPRLAPESPVKIEIPLAEMKHLPRMYPTRWQSKPWYRPQRQGIASILDRLLVWVGYHDDLPGPQYRSQGYRLEEMGPLAFEKAGQDEVMQMAEKLHGCPIERPWSRDVDESKVLGN